MIRLLRLLIPLALTAVVLAGVACDDDDDGDDGQPTAAVTTQQPPDETPADGGGEASELSDGVLQVGSDIAYAPIEFFEEGTENAQGLDIDLANALGEALGVEVEFINTGFDGIIGALQAQRFDVIMSAMTITEERQQEIDFIAYFTAGTGILVEAGNPGGIQSLADLCGKTVAVQVGTIQVEQAEAQSAECAEPIAITTFDLNPLAVEQLRLGRADAVLADYPVAANDARLSEGELEILDTQFDAAPYGIGVRKDSTELRAALEAALATIRDSGEYDSILASWGLEAGALE